MNSVTHIFMGWEALSSKSKPVEKTALPVFLGSLYPDSFMLIFFTLSSFQGIPQTKMWEELYYSSFWQSIFKIPNSFPIAIFILILGFIVKNKKIQYFSLATLLHLFVDFLTHANDPHIHFYPFSDFRFYSPVSYWDPSAYGLWVSSLEAIIVGAGMIFFRKRATQKWFRVLLILMFFGYLLSLIQYLVWMKSFN